METDASPKSKNLVYVGGSNYVIRTQAGLRKLIKREKERNQDAVIDHGIPPCYPIEVSVYANYSYVKFTYRTLETAVTRTEQYLAKLKEQL